jgi:hypothetical protein
MCFSTSLTAFSNVLIVVCTSSGITPLRDASILLPIEWMIFTAFQPEKNKLKIKIRSWTSPGYRAVPILSRCTESFFKQDEALVGARCGSDSFLRRFPFPKLRGGRPLDCKTT